MARKTVFIRDFYYCAADDRFIKVPEFLPLEDRSAVTSYKFKIPKIFPTSIRFQKNDPPLVFRISPESLLNLAITVFEKSPLPNVYSWTTEQVCHWLKRYGYPEYHEAIRANLINGRTLLLLDASALTAMNIKNFEHICRITYGIRCLFHYELTKFGRSINLPPEYLAELYKLFRVKNGTKYEKSKASDLWRRLQIIRPNRSYKEHWEILERWLKFEHVEVERFGDIHRHDLYRCRRKEKEGSKIFEVPKTCHCIPPCECYWTERQLRIPEKLSMISADRYTQTVSMKNVLSVLIRTCPERSGARRKSYYSICKDLPEYNMW